MVCEIRDCKKQCVWSNKFGTKPKRCFLHKIKGDVNVQSKRCIHEGCNTVPSYAPIGFSALRCKKHCLHGDVNARNKKCSHINCLKAPNFGPRNGKSITCGEHKEPDYINLMAKICEENGCDFQAAFGFYKNKPTHCSNHKLENHINVKHKCCEHKDCKTSANFAKVGEYPLRCFSHKIPGDINVNSNTCEEPGCRNRPSFSTPGTKQVRCGFHQKEGDRNVIAKRCEKIGCDRQPSFAQKGVQAARCFSHKNEGDINVNTKTCISEACMFYGEDDSNLRGFATHINPDNGMREFCGNCFRSMYPELGKLRVRKEQFILAEIQRMVPELESYLLGWDCRLPGQSCSESRPDMVWKVKDTLIHVEIDECGDEHEDDEERIIGIHAASGCDKHVLIRFNPDKSSDGSPSCLRRVQLKSGDVAFSNNTNEWDKRIPVLVKHVREAFQKSIEGIEVVPWKCRLFF